MSISNKKRIHNLLRCPVCGKLSAAVNFSFGERGEHNLQTAEHYIWSEGDKKIKNQWIMKNMDIVMIRAMREVLSRVLKKLDYITMCYDVVILRSQSREVVELLQPEMTSYERISFNTKERVYVS